MAEDGRLIRIETHAYARAGLLGNPSDGYVGKTVALVVRNFRAHAFLYPKARLELRPSKAGIPLPLQAKLALETGTGTPPCDNGRPGPKRAAPLMAAGDRPSACRGVLESVEFRSRILSP